jgi:N-acetylmuramoyl-L-alanine amidase
MATNHTVSQGECLSSIAREYGFSSYRTIYDHPNNAEFKRKRPNPNVIYPGDTLYIPDKDLKEESKATEKKHHFKLKKEIVKLRVVLKDDQDQPYANMSYQLKVDDHVFKGTTGGDGKIEQEIPADARAGELAVFRSGTQDVIAFFPLELGELDPVEESTGIQARLNNLGFDCGAVDGIIGPLTQDALRLFQEKYGLTVTGTADATTREKLRELHDWT